MQRRPSLSLQQIQTQQQVLTPRLIQTLRLFQMPYWELTRQLSEAAQDNVFLDIAHPDRLPTASTPGTAEPIPWAKEITLHEHLANQVDYTTSDPHMIPLVHAIISHLDERGYLPDYVGISQQLRQHYQARSADIETALNIVQNLDPDGVGARSLKECLLLQIRAYAFDSDMLRKTLEKAVDQCLDAISRHDYATLCRVLNVSADGAQAIMSFIQHNLTPDPGSAFSTTSPVWVIPSFKVSIVENRLVLENLEQTQGIRIRLAPDYDRLLSDPQADAQTRRFLRIQLEKAKTWISDLEKRHQSGLQVVKAIVSHQEAFVRQGPTKLRPLLQKELAASIGLSPSTISRLVNGKYIDTPHGLFVLGALCPRVRFGQTSDQLKAVLAHHFSQHLFVTDADMVPILKNAGIRMARRTVSKYRSEWRKAQSKSGN